MLIKTFIDTAFEFNEKEILQKFHEGIVKGIAANTEFSAEISLSKNYTPCDVAVMFGSWKPKDRDHHIIRNSIAELAPVFIVIETPLLNRKVFEENSYYRIGVNGFLNNQGLFNYGTHQSDRAARLNIQKPSWRINGDEILLFLQLPGDASLRGTNIYHWAYYTITELRKRTLRPIKIRTHPKHNIKDTDEIYKLIADLTLNKIEGIKISFGKEIPLAQDLAAAYCTVAFTSGSSIDSILNGIPTIACDPGNFAYEISSNFVEEVENLKRANDADLQAWINRLSYSQWTVEEMRSGEAWRHLFPIVMTTLESKSKKKK